MRLFLKGISQYYVNDIIYRKTSAVAYMKNRSNRLLELGISQDHVLLFDAIFDEMNRNISRFISHGVVIDNLEDKGSILHYENARKAAIEYYFYEPFMPDEVLDKMRQNGILHPRRPSLSKEKLDELLQKQPLTWEKIN